MIASSPDEPVVAFTRFTRDWFRLLARGAFEDAASQLDEANGYGDQWKEQQIRAAIREYAQSDAAHVSDPDSISGDGHPSLVEFADGRGYSFEHDVPLDGKWSD